MRLLSHLTLLSLLAPTAALAHPGDHSQTGLLHILTEPDHLVPLVLVVLAAIVGYRLWARR